MPLALFRSRPRLALFRLFTATVALSLFTETGVGSHLNVRNF